jgi:cell division control protein 24
MEVAPPSFVAAPGRYPAHSAFMNPPPSLNGPTFGSHPSSLRSSDSTQATNSSAIFNPPPLPSSTPTLLPPFDNGSVLNVRGREDSSLFQICVKLRKRLSAFPHFEEALHEEESEAGEDADPVTILWRFLRRGYPLMDLYNSLSPRVPLEVDPNRVAEKKRGQAATYKFIQACMKELGITECFMVTDLYGDDTSGFVKVSNLEYFGSCPINVE